MCLYAADLRADGHEVDKALVHPSELQAAAKAIAPDTELLVLDSIFPFEMIRWLQEHSGLPVLVGGHNALQHILRGSADTVIVGAGRAALRAVVGGQPKRLIDGLFWRDEDGIIHCGSSGLEAPTPPSLSAELEPFIPELDWDYFGPPRAPGSNLRIPSIVADLGCVWNRSILGDELPLNPYEGVAPRLPSAAMTPAASARVEREFVRSEGGCSFCVLRYIGAQRRHRGAALDSLMRQSRVLVEAGAHGLSLQTEHPLPILGAVIQNLADEGLAESLDELHIRTIPWLLLRHRQELVDGIELAASFGIHLVLGQVGFEAFDELSLALFHKGLSVEDNRAAARLLTELDATSPTFSGTAGHGLIPLHPWTRPEDIRTNIQALRADAPWLLHAFRPDRRVELYAEWSPLFWKAEDEGLVRPSPDGFGWDWDFADPATGEIVAATNALIRQPSNAGSTADGPDLSAKVFEAVLDIWERERDPNARRQGYIALRKG